MESPGCYSVLVAEHGQEIPRLKVLSFDTSTPRGSVALLEGQELAAELRLLSLETHSARLLGSVEFLLKMVGWKLGDLGLIVAGLGPGSFTGIRIGVATALGLAQTQALPFAGISSLDALAHQLRGVDGRISVVMDAQRRQVFYAEYRSYRGRVAKLGKPVLMFPSDLKAHMRRKHVYVLGDGAIRYAEELQLAGSGWPRLMEVDLFLAASLGRLAIARKRSWRSGEYLCSEPLYIRPPDAFRRKVNTP
jgi:tRNA threonylcarbamoyladenosine biosynthesis protein TsaB